MALYGQITSSGVLLLDGEIGGGLRKRVVGQDDRQLVPAAVLLESPALVRDLHHDYIRAGARVITTNTYATVRQRLEALLGLGERWEEMVTIACEAAVDARAAECQEVLIAGSLPPLHGSYRPDGAGALESILPVYREHVRLMAKYVDFFLCETMSTAEEGRAAAMAAAESGKPVWVSWNLRDGASPPQLRSGESLQQAWAAVEDLQLGAVLVNCCAPETVAAAIPDLARMGPAIFGGYGNGFTCIPEGWTIQGGGLKVMGKRRDLTPAVYAEMAMGWVAAGARALGGCCEVGPEYIALMHRRLFGQSVCLEYGAPAGAVRDDGESAAGDSEAEFAGTLLRQESTVAELTPPTCCGECGCSCKEFELNSASVSTEASSAGPALGIAALEWGQ